LANATVVGTGVGATVVGAGTGAWLALFEPLDEHAANAETVTTATRPQEVERTVAASSPSPRLAVEAADALRVLRERATGIEPAFSAWEVTAAAVMDNDRRQWRSYQRSGRPYNWVDAP
jgi:hypothetical protein